MSKPGAISGSFADRAREALANHQLHVALPGAFGVLRSAAIGVNPLLGMVIYTEIHKLLSFRARRLVKGKTFPPFMQRKSEKIAPPGSVA